MGFKDAWNAQMERSKNASAGLAPRYGLTYVTGDGKFVSADLKRTVAGAVAEYESGDQLGGRTTLTRVAAGAIIAGPVGAIVGGMFKKDRSRGYVAITFPDGAVVVVDGPAKDAAKLRTFAAQITAAGSHYSAV